MLLGALVLRGVMRSGPRIWILFHVHLMLQYCYDYVGLCLMYVYLLPLLLLINK